MVFVAKLDGISQQVVEDLLNSTAVGSKSLGQIDVIFGFERNIPIPSLGLHGPDDSIQHFLQIGVRFLNVDVTGFQFAVIQYIVDNGQQ